MSPYHEKTRPRPKIDLVIEATDMYVCRLQQNRSGKFSTPWHEASHSWQRRERGSIAYGRVHAPPTSYQVPFSMSRVSSKYERAQTRAEADPFSPVCSRPQALSGCGVCLATLLRVVSVSHKDARKKGRSIGSAAPPCPPCLSTSLHGRSLSGQGCHTASLSAGSVHLLAKEVCKELGALP